jgi:hypothetical protein
LLVQGKRYAALRAPIRRNRSAFCAQGLGKWEEDWAFSATNALMPSGCGFATQSG